MGRLRYIIYGLVIIGIFALIHIFFPRQWSLWLYYSDGLFLRFQIQFLGLYIFGVVLFFFYPLLFGIAFIASFGRISYPKGSEDFYPEISILMPVINEEKIIGATLDSFVKSNYPKDKIELIVIASGSTDKTTSICQEYEGKLNVKVLTDELPKKGKPAALNHGLKHATHGIICVYDADTRFKADTLQYLVRHLYDPNVAAAGGPVMVRNWNDNALTRGVALEFSFLSGTGLYYEIRHRLGRTVWVMGRNYCIRKKIIEEFGGWNEKALTEDLHLSSQLSAAKKNVRFARHAIIDEKLPSKYETFKKQRRRWVGGYNQSLSAAMELDRRSVILRNLGMMHFGHIADFSIGAIVATIIFAFIDLYLMIICLSTFIFTFGMVVNAVRKYGEGRYKLLLYYFVYIFVALYMFQRQFKSYESLEWEKTEL